MNAFAPTHKLVAPTGEEIPVMLVSQHNSLRYGVMSKVEYQEGSQPIYHWHPSEGVTYKGVLLDGLEIRPLESGNFWEFPVEPRVRNNSDWSRFGAR